MLSAFAQILRVVTSPWTRQQVNQWNELVDSVSKVIAEENKADRARVEAEESRTAELHALRSEVATLRSDVERGRRELAETRDRYERELGRTQVLIDRLSPSQVAAQSSACASSANAAGSGLEPDSSPLGRTYCGDRRPPSCDDRVCRNLLDRAIHRVSFLECRHDFEHATRHR
jgi:hypothetical protein